MHQLIFGDCREELRKLPDNSVRLIIADPPYGDLIKEDWDKISDYEAFTASWLDECKRLLTDDGSIYVWCSIGPKSSSLLTIASLLKKNWHFQDMIVWKKQRGRGNRKGWLFVREEILWATKQPKDYYWNTKFQYSSEMYDPSWVKRLNKEDNPYKRATNVWTDIEEPTIEIARESGGKGSRSVFHPCQKPIKSLERIILAHTDVGDLILDPFLGAGSTCIACEKNKRYCIGIENNQKYYDIAVQRVNQCLVKS